MENKNKKKNFLSPKALLVFFLAVPFLFAENIWADEKPGVIISEIYASDNNDWIELYNNTDEDINLLNENIRLYKASSSAPSLVMRIGNDSDGNYPGGVIIKARDYYLVVRDDADKEYLEMADAISSKDSFTWTGSGHTIYLGNDAITAPNSSMETIDDDIIDFVGFGNAKFFEKMSALEIPQGVSIGRILEENYLLDSGNNGDDFIVQSPTPGAENSTEPPVNDEDIEEDIDSGDNEDKEENGNDTCLFDVSLNEVLPNPSGEETRNEYIEIKNNSDSLVDLSGWKLYDSVLKEKYDNGEDLGYEIPAGNSVKPGGFWIVYRDAFKFSLHNTQEEAVFLKNSCGNFISQTDIFKGAKEDYAYSFDGVRWRWSSFLTPEKENKFDSIPQVEIIIDKKVFKGIAASFEADIIGKGKNSAKVVWDFGDGRGSGKKKTTHIYGKVGKYSGSVKVSGAGEDFFKRFDISVEKFKYPEVRIIGVNPNPPGKDEESESITIKNKSKNKINLKGWSIASGTSSSKLTNHPITEDLFVKAGKILEITREFSKFSLGNLKTKIELRYPDGKVAHDVKYKSEKNISEGMVYEKNKKGKWKWKDNKQETMSNEQKDEDSNNFIQEDENQLNVDGLGEESLGNFEVGQDGEIVSGFGFGEEEDVLEVVEMLINELDRDIDEIYAENDQEVESIEKNEDPEVIAGSQSVQTENFKTLNLIGTEVKIREKPQFTGTQTLRIEKGKYRFTRPLPEQPHYAVKFAKNTISDMNMVLSMILQKF